MHGATQKELAALQRDQATTLNHVTCAEENLKRIEQQLGVTETWTASCALYIETKAFIQNCKYLRAVDNLERLVVQRLFELTKMNLSGTGKSYIL